jgi:hypothetical protein
MTKDPWTDPDPQPGDFDAEIDAMDPREVQVHEANPDATMKVLVGVSSEDARRLAEIADERGGSVEQVVAELVRDA